MKTSLIEYSLETDNFMNELIAKKNILLKDKIIKNKPSSNQVNLIIKLFEENKFELLLDIINKLLIEFPVNHTLHHILGAIYAKQNNFKKAIKCYEICKIINPYDEKIFNDTGNAQFKLGYLKKALNNFQKAIELNPKYSDSYNNIGNVYKNLDKITLAILNYKKAIKLNPYNSTYYLNLGQVYHICHKLDKCIRCFEKAVSINPSFENQLSLTEIILKEKKDAKTALQLINGALLKKPMDTRAVAYKIICLRGVNKFEESNEIISFNRLVQIDYLNSYNQNNQLLFNRKLAFSLKNHSDRKEEIDQYGWAIRGGTVIRNLFSSNDAIIKKFQKITKTVIDNAISNLDKKDNHPFLLNKPNNYRIDCWANLLKEGDFQSNHIHNNGWMSGVYYVELPKLNSNKDFAGWIEFNRTGYDLPHFGGEKDIQRLKPKTGMFILFPSYVWHGTIPYSGKDNRISISFDVVPI